MFRLQLIESFFAWRDRHSDVAAYDEAKAEKGEPIPWDEVKASLELDDSED